jgi:hypothetical protein
VTCFTHDNGQPCGEGGDGFLHASISSLQLSRLSRCVHTSPTIGPGTGCTSVSATHRTPLAHGDALSEAPALDAAEAAALGDAAAAGTLEELLAAEGEDGDDGGGICLVDEPAVALRVRSVLEGHGGSRTATRAHLPRRWACEKDEKSGRKLRQVAPQLEHRAVDTELPKAYLGRVAG